MEWDPSLYFGSAAYYPRGRLAYPRTLVDALATHAGLPHPRPSHPAIADLVRKYLGPVRRAGRGHLHMARSRAKPSFDRSCAAPAQATYSANRRARSPSTFGGRKRPATRPHQPFAASQSPAGRDFAADRS